MPWLKIAAIGAGIVIAFFIVASVIGTILHIAIEVAIAAAVVGGVVVAVKMARSRRQVAGKQADREVREPDHPQYGRPLPRADVEPARDVDDELARLKREMGG